MKPRVLLTLLAIAIASLRAFGQGSEAPAAREKLPNPPQGNAWKLIWSDEFDGTELDSAKWRHHKEGPRKGGVWLDKAVLPDQYLVDYVRVYDLVPQ